MVLIEAAFFTKLLPDYLSDDEYAAFQQHLVEHPESGKVIAGCGGARKVRWAVKGRGKSGGARVIYYWVRKDAQIVLLTIYGKGEKATLSAEEKQGIAAYIRGLR
jgi:mRNA-degrading endonuclease RelE of RelBE toxin-antitoxin system